MEADTSYVIDVLLHVTSDTAKSKNTAELMPHKGNADNKDKGEMIVVPIHPSLIQQISSVKLFIPKDLGPKDNRFAVTKSIKVIELSRPSFLFHVTVIKFFFFHVKK